MDVYLTRTRTVCAGRLSLPRDIPCTVPNTTTGCSVLDGDLPSACYATHYIYLFHAGYRSQYCKCHRRRATAVWRPQLEPWLPALVQQWKNTPCKGRRLRMYAPRDGTAHHRRALLHSDCVDFRVTAGLFADRSCGQSGRLACLAVSQGRCSGGHRHLGKAATDSHVSPARLGRTATWRRTKTGRMELGGSLAGSRTQVCTGQHLRPSHLPRFGQQW